MTPAELKAKQSAGIQAREIETDIGGTRTLIELDCTSCVDGRMYHVLEGGGPILHYCTLCAESEWINVKYPTLRWA
ncbi:MAG: hypothetical protein O7D91_21435 [Planctomycetota bacterium]|nr:hypothetical protein [Planctomycetota bacterium]